MRPPPLPPRIWLPGGDVYALRCAVLHEGSGDTSGQPAHSAIRKFQFVYPPGDGSVVHRNRVNERLQLQVDLFCEDMYNAVEGWLQVAERDRVRWRRMDKMMRIERLGLTYPT